MNAEARYYAIFIILLHLTPITGISFHGATAPTWQRPPHCRGFMITLRHTTVGRTPLDGRSARRRALYLITDNTQKIH